MNSPSPKFAILVGGGPAPGINSVIEAATIRSRLCGVDVLGIEDGFKWLMKGDLSHTQPLTRETVSHLHFRGGSLLGTSRANPTKHPQDLSTTFTSLQKLDVTGLITIGGDDTAFSAFKLAELAGGRLQVVHVPKTIDNDLCLPHGMPTFGFQTARHMGVEPGQKFDDRRAYHIPVVFHRHDGAQGRTSGVGDRESRGRYAHTYSGRI